MAVGLFDDLIPGAPRQQPTGDRSRAPSPEAGAISSIESSGRYDLLGPVTRTGDRAYGRYQVMGQNVGPWSQEVFGRPLTPQEFLANPQAQDAVFAHRFGQYSKKYGPEGAARAWFAGEGGMNDMGRRDQLGTSVAEYGRRFAAALPSSADPAGGALAFGEQPPGSPVPQPRQAGNPLAGPPSAPVAEAGAAQGAISFDDLIPEGGRFGSAPPGGNFRTAREGVSERYQPMGRMEAFGRGAASGLTANFYDELRALGEAGGIKPNEPLTLGSIIGGAYRRATGDEAAESRYAQTAARERGIEQKVEQDQPGLTLAGNIAGAVAQPGGAMLRAATMPQRIARGAAVGAGYGALAGAGGGEDVAERVVGAAAGGGLGGLVGGAAPVAVAGVQAAGRGIGAAISPITNTIRSIRDPEAEAARRVTSGIQRDQQAGVAGLTPEEFARARGQIPTNYSPAEWQQIQDALAAGGAPAKIARHLADRAEYAEPAPVTLMELGGETTRGLARSAANTSTEGRGELTQALQGRFGTQGDRVIGWLNRTFHYPNAQAQQAALDQVEQTVNRGAYRRAQAAADAAHPNGIWSSGLEELTSAPAVREAMQEASQRGGNRAVAEGIRGFNPGVTFEGGVMQFRRGPTGAPAYPDLRFWDLTQRNLRQASQVAARAGRNEEAGALTELRQQLLRHLDSAVPEFQAARGGAARFFGAENALEAGQNFVGSRMGNREAREAMARMSPQERQLFQDGFVSRYVEHLSELPDRRNVLNQVAQSPAARERLQMVLGRDRAHELEGMLRVEGLMQAANEAVRGNSTTARQLTELGLAGGVGGYGYLNSDPQAILNTALVYGAARGQRAIDSRVAREMARMLTSNDPTVLARGLRIVGRQGRFLDSLRATDQALARAGAGQASGAQIPQAAGIGRADQDEQ